MFYSQENVENLFEKKFEFLPSEEWKLPNVETWKKTEAWTLDELSALKTELNDVKCLLNDKGELWQNHTSKINKAALVRDAVRKLIKPEVLTQAWCKFYEILSTYPLIPDVIEESTNFRTFHLCEAPGAFVIALNFFLCLNRFNRKWNWFANTLNPYYEEHSVKNAVVDDRLLFHTLRNWHFGKSSAGDILSQEYLTDVVEFFSTKGPVHLVTADGSFNCMEDPGSQEILVADLHFSEVLIALSILAPGGSFVIKKFTLFECISICTMYLLNCVFEKVVVFKPVTSKAGNSEVYVICLNYKGVTAEQALNFTFIRQNINYKGISVFPKESIPESFLSQLVTCSNYFAKCQIEAIKENLSLFPSMTTAQQISLNEIQESCVEMYIRKYSLDPAYLCQYNRLVPIKKIHSQKSPFGKKTQNLKLQFHQMMDYTYDNIEQRKVMNWEEKLQNFEYRLNECMGKRENKRKQLDHILWFPVWKDLLKFMKFSKNLNKWITYGRKIKVVKNSKFCNPLILLIWEEIMQSNELGPVNHKTIFSTNWDWDCAGLFSQSPEFAGAETLYYIDVNNASKSTLVAGLLTSSQKNFKHCKWEDDMLELSETESPKIIVLDVTTWCTEGYCNEPSIKSTFAKVISAVIKILKEGDSVVLCIESLLTRFMVGIHFLVLSLFSQITILHAGNADSKFSGQVWVLANFQHPHWTKSMLEYIDKITSEPESDSIDVLEVLPITTICSGHFYDCVLEMNNKCMLQRIYNILTTEKNRLKKN